jgi:hypothetical protein
VTEQPRRVRQSEVVELRVTRTVTAVQESEQHLGDRMAAFVDGELPHEARERVQSHLASCAACLARVEEERRLKSRLAEALAPDPSAVFMSRLLAISLEAGSGSGPDQGAPGSGGGGQTVRSMFGGSSLGGGAFGGGTTAGFGSGLFGRGALGADNPVPGVDPRAERGLLPFRGEQRPIAARLRAGTGPSGTGSQERRPAPEPTRAAQPSGPGPLARGRRFAFAAAGAFSVAAVALGSAVTGVTASGTGVEEPYGNVAPVADAPGVSGAGAPELNSRMLDSRLLANQADIGANTGLGGAAPAGLAVPTATASSVPVLVAHH